jgi:hypothetical protein
MAGAMKKAGYTVESFKPENGERTTASTRSIGSPPFRPPGSGRGGLFYFWPRFLPLPAKCQQPWPLRQAPASQANVGQRWRSGGHSSALFQQS